MQLTPGWFDDPGEATAPNKEITIQVIGPDTEGVLKKRSTQALLRYVSEADLLKAKLRARKWLVKEAGGATVSGDLVLQAERPFVLAAALGDPEDPARALFMSTPQQSGGELALEHLTYAAAQPLLEQWEAFMEAEFPISPSDEQHEKLKETARD